MMDASMNEFDKSNSVTYERFRSKQKGMRFLDKPTERMVAVFSRIHQNKKSKQEEV